MATAVVNVRENHVGAVALPSTRRRPTLGVGSTVEFVAFGGAVEFLKLVMVTRLGGCCRRAATHSWIVTCRDRRRRLVSRANASSVSRRPTMT
jgi:hypothetical protein